MVITEQNVVLVSMKEIHFFAPREFIDANVIRTHYYQTTRIILDATEVYNYFICIFCVLMFRSNP